MNITSSTKIERRIVVQLDEADTDITVTLADKHYVVTAVAITYTFQNGAWSTAGYATDVTGRRIKKDGTPGAALMNMWWVKYDVRIADIVRDNTPLVTFEEVAL